MATSGFWASSENIAKKYVSEIYESILNNENKDVTCVIRVSLSQFSSAKLGHQPLINLINLFRTQYKNNKHLELQIHTFEGDPELSKLLTNFTNYKIENVGENISDSKILKKNMPKQQRITL